jgi:hypothetical protein
MSTTTHDLRIKPMSRSNRISRVWWIPVPAIMVATIANVLFYYILSDVLNVALFIPDETGSGGTVALTVSNVIFMSVVFSLGAGIVFLIIAAFSPHPIRWFVIISMIVLVLSFALPLMLSSDQVTLETKIILMAMHVLGAILVVGIIIRLSEKQLPSD